MARRNAVQSFRIALVSVMITKRKNLSISEKYVVESVVSLGKLCDHWPSQGMEMTSGKF